MGFHPFQALRTFFKGDHQARAWTETDTPALLNPPSQSGKAVNASTALGASAVLSCVRAISETIAQLPLHVMRDDNGQRVVAEDAGLDRLLHVSPNPEQTSFEFREQLQASVLMYGTAYAEIERNSGGMITGLWPLNSANALGIHRAGAGLFFEYMHENKLIRLPAADVLVIRGFTPYGLLGLSMINTAKESIGLSLAQEEYAARFFKNNASPTGVLEHPNVLDDESHGRLRRSWEVAHSGLSNSHRVAILEEGMKFSQTGATPEAAQLLAGRTYQIQEIARVFRMPLHKVAEMSGATFSNIEQQGIEYVQDTIQPWVVRWEQRIDKQILSGGLYSKFNLNSLLRGDSPARAAFYSTLFNIGVFSINDIRALEDMNPVENGNGHHVPLNLADVTDPAVEELEQLRDFTSPYLEKENNNGSGNYKKSIG